MATYSAADLRKGLKIELDGIPYAITEFNFLKPGKGASIYNCRLKNMFDGSTFMRGFRSNDTVGKPDLDERRMRFSYAEGDNYIFLDDNFEQVTIPGKALDIKRFFLMEDIEVEVLFFNGLPIEVNLPTFIEKEILETEPGARGNTATNVLKAARIAGGYELQVPLFINQGDIIKIDTRTGEYADRVLKR
jgi:elongation factor P